MIRRPRCAWAWESRKPPAPCAGVPMEIRTVVGIWSANGARSSGATSGARVVETQPHSAWAPSGTSSG